MAISLWIFFPGNITGECTCHLGLYPLQLTPIELHRVSKNVPPLAGYNFVIRERILILFGRNVRDIVSNQRCFTMPLQITCVSALPGKAGKHGSCIFTQMLSIRATFVLDFFNLFDSRLILTLLYDSLNLVIRSEVQSAAADGLCCTQKASVRCILSFLFRKVMLKH